LLRTVSEGFVDII